MHVKYKYDLTIIVPFYKRDNYALEILKLINNENIQLSYKIEIIYVDSKSSLILQKKLNEFNISSNISVRVVNAYNSAGAKRNKGIKEANSSIIICLDDDCLPGKDFLKHHVDALNKKNSESIIYSGLVYFPEDICKSSNYYKFRNQRHRVFDEIYKNNQNIDFHNIITMNMSFRKENIIEKKILFDEDYTTYGLEDTQFGLDAMKKGFTLKTCLAPIYHQESTSIELFILKIRNFSQNYFHQFYKKNSSFLINKENTKYFNNGIIPHSSLVKLAFLYHRLNMNYPKILLLLKTFNFFFHPLILILKTFLKKTDNKSFLYSFWAYKMLIIITILSTLFGKKIQSKDFI